MAHAFTERSQAIPGLIANRRHALSLAGIAIDSFCTLPVGPILNFCESKLHRQKCSAIFGFVLGLGVCNTA